MYVNGIRQFSLPYVDKVNGLRLYYTWTHVVVYIDDLEIEVKWSGTSFVTVIVPGRFQEETCGVCANFNNNPDDDLTLGPKCVGDTPGALVMQPLISI